MDPLNDNVASLLHQSSDHFVSELWKEGETDSHACLLLCTLRLWVLHFMCVQYEKKLSLMMQHVLTWLLFFLCSFSTLQLLNLSAPLTVLLPSRSLLCLLAFSLFLLSFSLLSPLIWCSLGLLLSFPLISLPALYFSLHQIFKLFLVCTSLTPMPHCRPMAPTVGFSPPLCVTLTFLTPTSAHISLLFSGCPVFDCSAFSVSFVYFLVAICPVVL